MIWVGLLLCLILGWQVLFMVAVAVAAKKAAKALEEAAGHAAAQVQLSQSMDEMQRQILAMNEAMMKAGKSRSN